jgi:hypothetical protein
MPGHVKVEITHCDEMNNKMFDIDIDIDMNLRDNARNVIEAISFHGFHGQSNSTIHIYVTLSSFIDSSM